MRKKLQPGVEEARFRCREAMAALVDIEIALAAPFFGSSLLLSHVRHARLKLGIARDSVFGLKHDLDHLCDSQSVGLIA